MGIVRVQKTSPPEPNIQEISKVILVVGGGLTGISAALDAAEAGSEVVLVEKSPRLGGWLAGAWKDLPSTAPYRDLETPQVAEKARLAQANAKIRVITGASIEKIAGAPGLFDVDRQDRRPATETIRVGAIVLATGSRPYDASKLAHLGFGAART